MAQPTGQEPALALAEDVLKTAKIGDTVVVVGNRLGGGVATQTAGRIRGLGPARVEVDARFQPGNSGSPIFDTTIQQIVGVATYIETARPGIEVETSAVTSPSGALGLKRETRWFGYRVDNVEKWEPMDWASWRGQMRRVKEYRDISLSLLAVAQGEISGTHENSRVRDMIQRYRTNRTAAEARNSDAAGTVRELMQAATAYAQEGLHNLDGPDYYDFFRSSLYWETNVTEQVKFREALIKAFKTIESDARSYQQRIGR